MHTKHTYTYTHIYMNNFLSPFSAVDMYTVLGLPASEVISFLKLLTSRQALSDFLCSCWHVS